ncbi:hypothetical protein [Algiphilus sp.]|uniref:hypothetical protein n=1 Tax=Algiphilus sp. TaxID=1872431 RepID=UPI003C57042F
MQIALHPTEARFLDTALAELPRDRSAAVDQLQLQGLREHVQRQIALGRSAEGRQVARRELAELLTLRSPRVELAHRHLPGEVREQRVHAVDHALAAQATAAGVAKGVVDRAEQLGAEVQIGRRRGLVLQLLEQIGLIAGNSPTVLYP